MGKRQKAKAARVAGHSCSYTTMTSLHGERADKQVGHGGELQLSEGVCGCADSPPIPSCQALVDKHCRAKCGGSATSLDGKWCEYHTRMRVDIHKSFHELLQAYHLTSNLTPDMALVQEATDLDWVESCWEQMHSRIDALNKALLCRTCFMDRLQGGDLDFKSKKYIKGLRDARTRLQSNLRTIEDHMFTLIGSSSEYQDSIAIILSQLYSRTDQQHRCVHHNMHPDGDTPTFMFPVDREYRHQLTGNFRGNVVDGYIAAELRRFRAEILKKLGVEIIRPASYEDSSHYRLLVRWDTNGGHRQAHIAAAYFRRLCFMESHLFVQAHRHMRTLETDQLPHITIENLSGQQLDFDKDLDPALLCMITFILSPRLKLSHLGILRDYLWWPAWSQVRTAVQDIYIDENAYPDGKRPVKPWWGKPPTPTLFATWNDRNDPEGALTLLCGMLYEASHPQVRRGDVLTSPHWSHLGSLVRCGKCLLSMAWSADDWFAIVREFSIRRIPMYSRIFPQVMGDGVGSLWTSDLATDVVRGQSDPGRGRMGLVSHPESEKECGSSQVPKSPDFGGNYRLDETLEIAGIVMLGVVTGGPVVRPDVEDDQRRQFLESFKLYPQVWFLLVRNCACVYLHV
ncbi:unnamed protein product [Rhizoctonia solani]|uniref:Uncharacterized protein n=1 Tax=Rhizoctonia solani TaxID=456999 RepID=A0A8H3D8K3_9AGAM|nr:unnamed protein product [Rhizoctonia solani]